MTPSLRVNYLYFLFVEILLSNNSIFPSPVSTHTIIPQTSFLQLLVHWREIVFKMTVKTCFASVNLLKWPVTGGFVRKCSWHQIKYFLKSIWHWRMTFNDKRVEAFTVTNTGYKYQKIFLFYVVKNIQILNILPRKTLKTSFHSLVSLSGF